MGIFLSDQRFHHELRFVFRCSAERENYLGEAAVHNPAFCHRIRRDDCRAAYLCESLRLVGVARGQRSEASVGLNSALGVERSAFSFQMTCHLSVVGHRWQNAPMKTSLIVTAFITASTLAASSFAQTTTTSPASGSKMSNMGQVAVPADNGATAPAGQPSAVDMQKMMQQMTEMSKLNENHKLLSSLDGNWDYAIKFWMNP